MSDVTQPLIPGQFVTHPEHGHGLVVPRATSRRPGIVYVELDDGYEHTVDLTGWQPAETLRPGHVQVRVDDLDLSAWEGLGDDHYGSPALRAGVRAAKAKAASRTDAPTAEPVADSDAPKLTTVGDGCECWVTPQRLWTTHYGAVEPGSQTEYNPDCPKHGEKPTTTTVSLPCPDCGEQVTREVALLRAEGSTPPAWSITPRPAIAHRCQPDEPTDPGSKVTVNDQHFVLADDDADDRWINIDNGDSWRWTNLCAQGTVTLGWGDET